MVCFLFFLGYLIKIHLNLVENMSLILKMTILPLTFHTRPKKTQTRSQTPSPHTTSYRFPSFTRYFLTISNDYNENHVSMEGKEIVRFHVLFRLSYKNTFKFRYLFGKYVYDFKNDHITLNISHVPKKKIKPEARPPHPTRPH